MKMKTRAGGLFDLPSFGGLWLEAADAIRQSDMKIYGLDAQTTFPPRIERIIFDSPMSPEALVGIEIHYGDVDLPDSPRASVVSVRRWAVESVAATLTTSGMRESVTLENSSAPSSYSFPVTLSPGEFLASNPDGSVSVMQSFSGGSISVGTFGAPWAKDATGALVPTSYSVQGSTLVQTVQTTPSTVYPVVADPYWIHVGADGSIDVRLTQKEQIFWYNATPAELAVIVTAICLVVGGVGCVLVGGTVVALVTGAVAVIDVFGICPATDYRNIFKGAFPWDGVVTSCIPY